MKLKSIKNNEKLTSHQLLENGTLVLRVSWNEKEILDKDSRNSIPSQAISQTAAYLLANDISYYIGGCTEVYIAQHDLIFIFENINKFPFLYHRTSSEIISKIASYSTSVYPSCYIDSIKMQMPEIFEKNEEELEGSISTHLFLFDVGVSYLIGKTKDEIYTEIQDEIANESLLRIASIVLSQEEIHGKNKSELKKLLREKEVYWEELPVRLRFGIRAVYDKNQKKYEEFQIKEYQSYKVKKMLKREKHFRDKFGPRNPAEEGEKSGEQLF